ncbi:MAG: hypothetical protein OEW11_06115 [Nitrospirota bacterium]|nr:hypothetical protein [Nitrospirota bacterium]
MSISRTAPSGSRFFFQHWLLAGCCLLWLSGCATLTDTLTRPAATPEAMALAQSMEARRAGVVEVAALAEVRVHGLARLRVPFPAAFTATLTHRPGDRFFALSAFGPMGAPLFTYISDGDVWRLSSPGTADASGTLGETAGGDDMAAVVLGTLCHLLDGAVGVDLHGHSPRPGKRGEWRAGRGAGAIRFRMDGGRLVQANFKRPGLGRVHIAYADYLSVGGPQGADNGTTPAQETPRHMRLEVPRHGLVLEVEVTEWVMGGGHGPLR